MSVTSALSSALTGLTATSRQAEAVSSNVANATTPGYARREVSLTALSLGGSGQGVAVRGITRQVDRFLIDDRRAAQAAAGDRDLRAAFLNRLEKALGDPTDPGSLSARIAAFDTALMEAASRPESEARLSAAADAARQLAQTLNRASEAVQAERLRADGQIATAVEDLNAALRQVRELNSQIRSFTGAGRDVSALLDQRQQIVDGIAEIVPLREVEREHGQIALMTTGGAVLLDGKESVFGFTPVNTLVPEMTQASGGLSGLTLNGRPMATSGETSLVLGGTLAGLFAVRDDLAVQGQARLDAVARDLVERFGAAGLDATLAPGAAGLFTDNGAAFDPADETGLSARIALNAAADPQAGGQVWRLRDGLGAAAPGATGNAALLVALSEALTAARPTASAALPAASRSLSGLAADLLSFTASDRLNADTEQAFTAARHAALDEMEKAGGVDTDQELQALLVIEKNYAANAKVLQTVDEMINTLLGL
ncbi:flagellar hook-associated protein FlgK [Rhodobacter sp. SGA-6-6]|uniref:flagellar hook-associated protein FlgK n=1 Tax=Rhodobacter sp. SGA-6-6 TaxID=2710882 RepID=UPI0013EAC3E1|nr:flagellar hook-associated protein FlgK [Rhodobacter sp. SGA-6-6]NGM45849.1 flagellar hook-associated protein FlgK [Rhodobacter sp. SGA-6-6]